jgi:hypothetical protein
MAALAILAASVAGCGNSAATGTPQTVDQQRQEVAGAKMNVGDAIAYMKAHHMAGAIGITDPNQIAGSQAKLKSAAPASATSAALGH